ncbi:MAG: response regulator transcription factor CtrA [Geminicoccaceae bacterium]
MRALVVEDDAISSRLIECALFDEKIVHETVASGEEAVEMARHYDFDIIILDLGLPDISGQDVLRRLRAARVRTPVLILSGHDSADEKVQGLSLGADDYLTKPFNPGELTARVQAIVRRTKGHSDSVIRTGRLVVNLDTRSVEIDNRQLHVTGKEYRILELLSLRKGTTLTKEMFLDHLYGGVDEPEVKIIDVFICKLRKKLAAASGGEQYIRTVWGRGYMLAENDDDAIEAASVAFTDLPSLGERGAALHF